MTDVTAPSPMEFVIRLCCIGEVDTNLFTEATLCALKQQPLLQANASLGPTHLTSFWRPASNTVPVIQWLDGDPSIGRGYPDSFLPIDLETEIGFRLYGWRFNIDQEPRMELRFVFHHACCDGKGSLDFIAQVLQNLSRMVDGQSADTTSRFDKQSVLKRGCSQRREISLLNRIRRTLIVRPKRAANMLLIRPRSLGSKFTCGAEKPALQNLFADPPRQCSTTLDQTTTRQLGVFAKSHSATTNTVLARELFHALNECAGCATSDPDRKRALRLLIPFSLREERHVRMPAANCVSMAYIEANQSLLDQDGDDNPVLLTDLVRQFKNIRHWNLDHAWNETIETYAKLWPLIKPFKRLKSSKRSQQNRRPIATTVMSNLGRVFKHEDCVNHEGEFSVGSLTVKTVHLALPCNADLSMNFAVNFYCNRLTLDVSYLPSIVSRSTAQNLLDSWKSRIARLVEPSQAPELARSAV